VVIGGSIRDKLIEQQFAEVAFSRFDRRATQRALSLPLHAVTHVVY
jgi:hypothetical protein